ncbi:MAG: tRNA (adenosine(37)-N6)-threonylcarbamoyltransferase complex dimerization subunit type 1 TsaB [Cyanobacteriota bacterium]|nr:tRNA (adenosine(37)-N6)-threonylcarbamoyltransferase complex dimerization subunit type 1 TsaB [Cyanobacteriota bacterium]
MKDSVDSKTYTLALHATGPQLGLAIASPFGDRRCQTWDLGRDLSKHLHTHLSEFVKPQTWKDFSFLAAAKGPGSFTSTRIGLVVARTLAQQLEIPLFAISTLAAAAWSNKELCAPGEKIAVQLPATRERVFAAIYQCDRGKLHPFLPDAAMALSAWQETLGNWERGVRLVELSENLGDTVTSVLELAQLEWEAGQRPHWSEALPFYGQSPVDSSPRS